jgi:hypothetical protein
MQPINIANARESSSADTFSAVYWLTLSGETPWIQARVDGRNSTPCRKSYRSGASRSAGLGQTVSMMTIGDCDPAAKSARKRCSQPRDAGRD